MFLCFHPQTPTCLGARNRFIGHSDTMRYPVEETCIYFLDAGLQHEAGYWLELVTDSQKIIQGVGDLESIPKVGILFH